MKKVEGRLESKLGNASARFITRSILTLKVREHQARGAINQAAGSVESNTGAQVGDSGGR